VNVTTVLAILLPKIIKVDGNLTDL